MWPRGGRSCQLAVVFVWAAAPGCADAFDLDEIPPVTTLCIGRNGLLEAGLFDLCIPSAEPSIRSDWSPVALIDTGLRGGERADCSLVVNQEAGGEACVVLARNIMIGSPLVGVGERPLVLAATEDIVVAGSVSVASNATRVGSGADPGPCPSGLAGNSISGATGQASGGGAGGSWYTTGGAGGAGATGVPGGTPMREPSEPGSIRGGCRGGSGGRVLVTNLDSGIAGAGGGGVYLLAGGLIEIDGVINASGQAGAGGLKAIAPGGGTGGGGGGSGGLIALDAPSIVLADTARLVANGGGGGTGGSTTTAGRRGSEADPFGTYPFVGSGGALVGAGAAGGDGASGPAGVGVAGSQVGNAGAGGGGGGGGAGYIELFTTALDDRGALCSPACK